MKLTVIGSNSKGNAYALQAENGETLLLEAGMPLQTVKSIAKVKTSLCAGMLVSHSHGDHCRYISEYVKAGIDVYSTLQVHLDICRGSLLMNSEETFHVGSFRVTPIPVKHDVPCFSFLIHHPEMGALYFFTDCYSMKVGFRNVNTFLCECNYEDGLLTKAVNEGHTIATQADRIRLSHLSEAHAIEYLQECKAEESARQIVLIHGSSRHLNPQRAVSRFQQVLGIPTYYATKGLMINLAK